MQIVNEIPKNTQTIKQIADRLGIKKGSLQKKLSREPYKTAIDSHMYMVNGTKYIDEEGQEYIKSLYLTSKTTVKIVSQTIDEIPLSIDNDDRFGRDFVYRQLIDQLKIKDEQIKQLNQALLNEQRAHSLTRQEVMRLTSKTTEEPKRGFWDRLKAVFKSE